MKFGFNFGLMGGGSSIDPDLLIHYTFSEIQRVDGDATFDNKGTTKDTNDADLYCGTGLVLGATNELPIPVCYDLGANVAFSSWTMYGNNTIVDNGNDTFTLTVVDVDNGAYLRDDCIVGNDYISKLEILSYSETITTETISVYDGTDSQSIEVLSIGEYESDSWECKTIGSSLSFENLVIGSTLTFGIATVKQITTTGYLTYETDDGVVQIGNAVDGGSSEELVTNNEFTLNADEWYVGGNASWVNSSIYFNFIGGEGNDLKQNGILISDKQYLVTIDATIISAETNIQTAVSTLILDGVNTYIITANSSDFYIKRGSGSGESYINSVYIQETLPNSTTYTLVDDTYRWAYVNENPFSEADLTAIAEEPNKIVEFAFADDGTTIDGIESIKNRGEELAENGDFSDGSVGWNEQNGWIIDSGVATSVGANSGYSIYQYNDTFNNTDNIGKYYTTSFEITSYTSGECYISINGVGSSEHGTIRSAVGVYTETLLFDEVAIARPLVLSSDNFIGSIDNISIKEITHDKFYGFRENEGAYCVDALAGYGSEEVTNGTFDTDLSGWTPQAPWEWDASGRAHCLSTTSTQRMYQSVATTEYSVWSFDLEIVSGEAKTYSSSAEGSQFDPNWTTSGSKALIKKDLTFIDFRPAVSGDEIYVDNVSVREATASEIADYTDSIRTATANSQTSIQWTCAELDETGIPTAYNSVSNTAIMHSDTSISTGFKPNISQYSIEETVTGELQDFGSEEVLNGDFELGDNGDWTKQTGWTISDGKAHCDGTNGYLFQQNALVIGKTYLLQFEVKNYVSGIVRQQAGSSVSPNRTANGLYSSILTSSVNTDTSISSTGFIGSVDNISVKELTTKTQRTEQRLLTHTDSLLGVDLATGTISGNHPVISDIGSGWYNWANTASSTSQSIRFAASVSRIMTVRVELDVVVNGNSIVLGRWYDGSVFGNISPTNLELVTGINVFYCQSTPFDDIFIYPTLGGEFDVNIKVVSIKEVSTQNKYYIDGLEQDVTPPLPDPAVTINLNDTAVIGYADTIDRRYADFKVYDTVRTAEEILADHNKWISATYTVLTDGNGDPLVDSNGVYLYTI